MEIRGAALVAMEWLELRFDDSAPRVLVRMELRDGRAVVTAFLIVGEDLAADTFRSISPARVEAWLNRHGSATGSGGRPLTPAEVADFEARGVLFPQIAGIGRALDEYLAAAPKGPKVTRPPRTKRQPLTRPDGKDPEGFYRRVAEAYNDVLTRTNAPAPVLAEESGVPVATVRGWIAEARRRGALPPGKRGRATGGVSLGGTGTLSVKGVAR